MSALLGMQINQAMLFAGVGLFVLVMINRLRRSFGKTGGAVYARRSWQNDRRPEQSERSTHEMNGSARRRLAAALPDQESWEVELHRLAREVKGEIDTKMRALAELIQLAEDARTSLDDSVARAESLGPSGQHKGSVDSRQGRSVESGGVSAVSRSVERPRNSKSHRETARTFQTSVSADSGDDPRFERVYALADAGFSAAKIAGQIGTQVGEVELILSLRHANQPAMLAHPDLEASRPRAA